MRRLASSAAQRRSSEYANIAEAAADHLEPSQPCEPRSPEPRCSPRACSAPHPWCRPRHPATRGTASSGSRNRAGRSGPAWHQTRRGPRPVVALEQSHPPAQPGQRLKFRFHAQILGLRTADLAAPAGTAPNCSAAARSTVRPTAACAGQHRRGSRRSPCAADNSPASKWSGPTRGRARDRPPRRARRRWPALGAAGRGPRRRSAEREAVQEIGHQGVVTVCAACSRARTGWCRPAHHWAATTCSRATRLVPWRCRSAKQVRTQELAPERGSSRAATPRPSPGRFGARAGRERCRRPPARTARRPARSAPGHRC